MSAGVCFQTVGGQHQQSLGMYEFTLVCAVALEGDDSLSAADSYTNMVKVLMETGKYMLRRLKCTRNHSKSRPASIVATAT